MTSWRSILISCGARLSPFDIQELRDLMAEDELELDTLGDRKSALFVILSDTDSTFNFVAAFSTSCATRRTTSTGDACRSMCGACWMSLRTSVKSRTSTS